MVGGWANYKIHFEISWHFVVSMNLCRAIGVHLTLLTCVVDGDPLLGVVVQVWQLHRVDFQRDDVDIDQLKVRLWPLFH